MMRIPRRWQELYTRGKKLRKDLIEQLGRLPKIPNSLLVWVYRWRNGVNVS